MKDDSLTANPEPADLLVVQIHPSEIERRASSEAPSRARQTERKQQSASELSDYEEERPATRRPFQRDRAFHFRAPSKHHHQPDADTVPAKEPGTTDEQDKPWHLRIMPDELDRLHEHPMFALHSEAVVGGNANSILAPTVTEADREPTYRVELLRLFRQRIQLVTMIGLLIIPSFGLIQAYMAEREWISSIATVHCMLFALCLALRGLSQRVTNLLWARMLALIGYTMCSMAMAVLITQVAELPANQLLSFGAYHQMLLSVLLLPFTVWESLVIGCIVIGSMEWAVWMSAPTEHYAFYSWHVFVLCTTAIFMLCVAYYQTILRRQAFDSSFNLARSAAQLQALSVLDQLTGGFNRRHLERVLNIEIVRAVRFERPLSVIMFDLDNFKQVNDSRGHNAGDEVIREVWQAAANTVREIDTVARFGGDEFTIVLPEADEEAANTIAERLHTAADLSVAARFGTESPEGRVTISAGVITLFPTDPLPVATVLHWADEQLYEAKRNGRNCTVSSTISDDMLAAR